MAGRFHKGNPVYVSGDPSTHLFRVANAVCDVEDLEIRLFHRPLRRLYAPLVISRRLERLARLLEGCHSDPEMNLPRAARECAIESGCLNRRLRERTGWTFHQLLIRRRVLRAAELLGTTEADLPVVAFRAGFGSVRSLHRNFFRLVGVTPARYRKRMIQALIAASRGDSPARARLPHPGRELNASTARGHERELLHRRR